MYVGLRFGINQYDCQFCSWSAEQGNRFVPWPRSRYRFWLRETGSAVQSRFSPLIFFIPRCKSGTVLPRGFRHGVHLYRQPSTVNHHHHHQSPGQSRGYRVIHFLRTDGVHFPAQQTTSGIDYGVKQLFRVGNQYAECEERQ